MLVVVTVSIKIESDENKLIKIGTFSFEMNILYKYFDNYRVIQINYNVTMYQLEYCY